MPYSLRIKVMLPSILFVQESHALTTCLQCFLPTRYVTQGMAMGTYERDDLYLICSKLRYYYSRELSLLALCGSTMHATTLVALSPGLVSSFAVLHTEKLAFQSATLLS